MTFLHNIEARIMGKVIDKILEMYWLDYGSLGLTTA